MVGVKVKSSKKYKDCKNVLSTHLERTTKVVAEENNSVVLKSKVQNKILTAAKC